MDLSRAVQGFPDDPFLLSHAFRALAHMSFNSNANKVSTFPYSPFDNTSPLSFQPRRLTLTFLSFIQIHELLS